MSGLKVDLKKSQSILHPWCCLVICSKVWMHCMHDRKLWIHIGHWKLRFWYQKKTHIFLITACSEILGLMFHLDVMNKKVAYFHKNVVTSPIVYTAFYGTALQTFLQLVICLNESDAPTPPPQPTVNPPLTPFCSSFRFTSPSPWISLAPFELNEIIDPVFRVYVFRVYDEIHFYSTSSLT